MDKLVVCYRLVSDGLFPLHVLYSSWISIWPSLALLALSKSEREVLTLERFVQSQSILIKKENASAPCIEINESLGYVGKGGTFFSLVKIVFSVIPMMAKLTFI